MRSKLDEQKHYQSLARYYTNLTILKRCKAVIHFEDKSDEIFWKVFFNKCFPDKTFLFLLYSKNPEGNKTTGCEQCLKFKHFLNKSFLICIDSDYRYLLQEPDINIRHFIFQTYTYSFENHICFSNGLDDICKLSAKFDNSIYDFNAFFKKYSIIIYDLFIWHIALYKKNPKLFNINEFCSIINLGDINKDIYNQTVLFELKEKVDKKIEILQNDHPDFNLIVEKEKYVELGVTKENVYLYIRGHNIFSLCVSAGKAVCNEILKIEKSKITDPVKIKALYDSVEDFEKVIYKNIQLGIYPEIIKIEDDMKTYQAM